MLTDIEHYNTTDHHVDLQTGQNHAPEGQYMETHVMLRHPRGLQNRNRITDVVSNVLEIEDTGIVVVLPREENKREIHWMDVCQETVVCVPAAKHRSRPPMQSKWLSTTTTFQGQDMPPWAVVAMLEGREPPSWS